jgi:hypothetical protein
MATFKQRKQIDIPGETRQGWPLLTVETEVNGDSDNKN